MEGSGGGLIFGFHREFTSPKFWKIRNLSYTLSLLVICIIHRLSLSHIKGKTKILFKRMCIVKANNVWLERWFDFFFMMACSMFCDRVPSKLNFINNDTLTFVRVNHCAKSVRILSFLVPIFHIRIEYGLQMQENTPEKLRIRTLHAVNGQSYYRGALRIVETLNSVRCLF